MYDHSDLLVRFGADSLKQSLKKKNIYYVEQYEKHRIGLNPSQGILVRKLDEFSVEIAQYLGNDGFSIKRNGALIIIEGVHSRGIMYGCFEWAERILLGKNLKEGEEILQKPALSLRGIKFNLPYAAFDEGDPFLENEKTCMDMDFWRPYLDMMAMNRYNCLSLWSEHPFHLMVVSHKYRNANPFSDEQIQKNIHFFKELLNYAANRGIDVYLFTWNIRLLPEVARGLELPETVGDFGNMYDHLIHRVGTSLNRFRGQTEIIKDYFREMILQVLITYPELKGIGTSASEWMDGTGYEREQWISDTYIKAIKESGRKTPFIHRTNMQNAGKEIKDLIQNQFDQKDFYISWKYSNAHCYSHPIPKFEDRWNAWEGIDLETTQVLYTVRNDDVFTLRWGDPDYIRSYVKGMIKPYVKGFYWGADGYIWGNDFQHIDHGHKTWNYDFEKHLFQFQLWGRLSYNPEIDDRVWELLLSDIHGQDHSGQFLEGLRYASKIIPAVNRLFWLDYDFQWHPESCLSQVSGFKTILDFVDGNAMPGVGVMSIKEFAAAEVDGTLKDCMNQFQETPIDIINILSESADRVQAICSRLSCSLGDFNTSHNQCTLLDLQSWIELGRYYLCKFQASLELNRFSLNGNLQHKSLAISFLEQASTHWERLGHYWSLHNKPYFMARVKMTFGYPYYLENTKKDIELAKQFEGNSSLKVGKEHRYSL